MLPLNTQKSERSIPVDDLSSSPNTHAIQRPIIVHSASEAVTCFDADDLATEVVQLSRCSQSGRTDPDNYYLFKTKFHKVHNIANV